MYTHYMIVCMYIIATCLSSRLAARHSKRLGPVSGRGNCGLVFLWQVVRTCFSYGKR